MKNLTTIITAIFLLTSITTAQNYSLSFDGVDDYVEIPSDDAFENIIHELTLQAWIKLDNMPSDEANVISRRNFVGNPEGERHHFELDVKSDGSLYFSTSNNQDNTLYTAQSNTQSGLVTSGVWCNVAVTFNDGLIKFYVNGISVYTEDFGYREMFPNQHWVNFGRVHRAGGTPFWGEFPGKIDEISIWGAEKTETEIQSYMSTPPTGDESGLVGYWNFNEGTGTTLTDQTLNGNDGTINGATWSTDVPPPTNTYSLSFDGTDDYVDLANKPITGVQNQFSILSYFKTNSLSINQGIYFHGGGYKDVGLRIDLEGSEYLLHFFILTSAGSQGHTYAPVETIDTGAWHHAAGTYDGQDIKLYVDGNLIIETAFSTDVDWDQGTQYGPSIGGGNSQCPTFDGNIDEMSFWTVALSQTEIQAYMSTSLSGSETSLAAHWNFNEGTGNTASDATSNGNDGTISGATWSTDVPFSGTTTTTSALTWSVQAQASLGSYNDNDNYLGVASDATNTFDAAYDEVEPPVSPGSSISLYFPHPEWNSILGDNFSTDARPEIALTDTMQVWDFEVVSTDAGDATLTFVFTDVPSVPVILENTATGARENLSNNETYTFTAVADSAHPFRVSIGDTTAPALALGSSCTGPAILISDSTHSLGWTSTDGYEVDSVLVSFSSDSGTTYALQAALGTVSGYNWTVPDAIVMTAGKFKIKAQDYAGNSTEKISDYVFAIAGDSLSSGITAGWTLWGVPINPANDTMSTNLNDDFTDYWVTYDYVDNGYTYDGILAEAEGYWLGAVQDATIDIKGTPVDSNFTMSLSQGWELISNPLVLDVSVDSLTFTKNDMTKTHAEAVTAGWVNSIYGYSGTGYTAASTFAPWSGYWVAVLETGVDMSFPIHRHDGSGSARSREDDWMITLDAQVDGANDGTTMIGYAETATDGFDAEHDAVQPPNPPGPDYVSLFIAHPEWNYPLGDKFAKDIRATVPDDEYKEWLLSIESSESDVQLNWTLMNIPDDYEVGYNIDDGIYFNDMRSVGTINISADTEIIVRVGSQVLGIDDETIPYVYALQQNYPNPFNPVTTLRYDLPEQANVNIIIYDMLGRQVKSLINQTQDAGFKSVIWNATNDYGKPVSAGVYLYKIQSGEFVQTKKMVLLK